MMISCPILGSAYFKREEQNENERQEGKKCVGFGTTVGINLPGSVWFFPTGPGLRH